MSKADTNQASELFDLCKKVYELTGWSDETLEKMALSMADSELHTECPLYTSDYLLEKLPRYEIVDNGVMATASFYDSDKDAWYYGDDRTALKALLKLVIALEKAGVEL